MEANISVLMSVYKNDIAENVIESVESVVNQTLKPKQIVMVVDGFIPETITKALQDLKEKYDIFEVYPLEQNQGLGKALNYGLTKCKYNFIARMDSDDISKNDRFEKQIKCFEKDDELSLVGSNIQEFFNSLDNLAGTRIVPEKHDDIVNFLKSRNPFCHMTIMAKKDMLEKAGNYQHWYYLEDWYMWIRMYLAGAKFYNIQETLVYARINYDTFSRRGGIKYYKSIKALLKFMKSKKIIGFFKYTFEKCKRFIAHVLIPKKIKSKLYMKLMRK